MLQTLRKGVGSWVAKIFIGLLVLSFAVWGIADVFGVYGQRSLAKVGDREISNEEFRFALQTQLQVFGRQFGRTLTMEEARALGIDQNVLSRLVGNAAIETHASDLKLGITDQAIADGIKTEKTFHDTSGRFSKELFDQLLRANGLTEQSYIERQRKESLRRQLTRVVSETTALPKTLLEAVDRFQNEKRVLKYFSVPVAKLEAIPKPSDDDLKSYFESHKSAFTAPQFRRLGLIDLSPSALAASIEIGEDQLKASYDAKAASYVTPEKRRVLRISFPDDAAAKKAHERLVSGVDFMAVAKEMKLTESDIDLGSVTKSGLVDAAIAEAAFKLGKDEVSAPVKGQFGMAIVKVTEIAPKAVRTFDEVKPQIRAALAKERATSDILDLHDKIEDERAAGSTLAEIAKNLALKYFEIPAVDRRGNGSDGKPVQGIPADAKVLRTAFESDVGVENDPIETADQGFVWVDVLAITPAKLKPFDTVRDEVAKAWRTAEERKQLSKKGQELVDRARKGEPLATIAKAFGAEIRQTKPLRRTDSSDTVPSAAVTQAFALSKAGAGSAPSSDGKSRVIFKIAKIEAPEPLNAQRAQALETQLKSLLADDYVSQYVSGLRNSYGVTVNQVAYNQLTGRDGGGDAPRGGRLR